MTPISAVRIPSTERVVLLCTCTALFSISHLERMTEGQCLLRLEVPAIALEGAYSPSVSNFYFSSGGGKTQKENKHADVPPAFPSPETFLRSLIGLTGEVQVGGCCR